MKFLRYTYFDPSETLSIPFHAVCLQLFARALRYKLREKGERIADTSVVDKDVLYAAMAKLHEGYRHCLKLDYEELEEFKTEQYWTCRVGRRYDCFPEGII